MSKLLRMFRYVRDLERTNGQLLSQLDEAVQEIQALRRFRTPHSESLLLDTPNIPADQQEAFGAWVCYRLRLVGISQADVAASVGVTQQMVQRVAYGASTSARVQRAIAGALGYQCWADVVAARQGVAA